MEDASIPAIEVRNLIKRYSGKVAVNGLSLEVPQQTITGFIGPNGAGKTTTLRILATLLPPTSGMVKVLGKKLGQNPKAIRHQLGFMPDYFGIYEDMTTLEYLDFFAAAYHIPARQRQKLIDDILELIDLSAKKNALVTQLSRGMQQRLSLGRALVHDPKLLLLDEPASGLDPRARIELMELLRELRSMGKTIFISSHILAELRELCDFVVIIEQGKLLYQGTVSQAVNEISGAKRKIRITLGEKAAEAAQELDSITGVSSVEVQGKALAIECEAELEVGDIVRHLVSRDYRIEEVRRDGINLEDVFMSMTRGGISE